MLDDMKALLREKDICVLATASKNVPHTSLMAYAANEAGTELYMATRRDTRKFANISENPLVSVLVDTREEDLPGRRGAARALTVGATAEVAASGGAQTLARGRILSRHPEMRGFLDDPEVAVLVLRIRTLLLLSGLTDARLVVLDDH